MRIAVPFVFVMTTLLSETVPDAAQLNRMAARFAPTEIRVDTQRLPAEDRRALVKLIQASQLIDDIFLQQLWSGNQAMYSELKKDTTPLGRARLHYFWMNK